MILKFCGVRSWSILKTTSMTTTVAPPVRKMTPLSMFLRTLVPVSPPPTNTKKEVPVSEIIEKITGNKRKREDDTKKEFKINIVEIYKIEDHDVWRTWRNEKKLPSASMISSYFGEGYRSLNNELMSIIGKFEEPVQSPVVKKMMDHGSEYEKTAKDAYFEYSPLGENLVYSSGENSYIFNVKCCEDECEVIATPDLVISSPDGSLKKVVEFKCPAYDIIFKKDSPIKEISQRFLTRYPIGKPSHFFQAAMYAFLFDAPTFDVFCLFTNGISQEYLCFKYHMTENLKTTLFRAMFMCTYHIKRLEALSPEDVYPVIRAKDRKLITELAGSSFDGYYYGEEAEVVLEEESSEDGKD